MNEALRVAKNTMAMSAGKIWMTLGNTVFTIIIARLLGVAGFGAFISLTTLYDLFRGLVSMGLSVIVTREVAKDRDLSSVFLSNGLIVSAVLSVIAAGAVYLMARSDAYSAQAGQASIIIGIALLPACAVVMFEALLIAYERMEYITAMTVVETVIRVGLSLLVLWRRMGLVELMGAMVVSQTVMLIGYYVLITTRLHRLSWRPSLSFMRSLVKDGSVLTVQSALATIGSRIGIVALTFLSGNVAVGLFAAAGKLLRISLLVDSYRDAIFPNMARLTSAPEKGFRQIIEKSLKYLLIAFLPITVGLFVLADRFIYLFFSSEYAGAVGLLQLMSWGLIAKVTVPLLSRALIALGDQQQALKVTTVDTVGGTILTVILIPLIGPAGIIIAGYITSVVSFVMLHHYLVKRSVRINYVKVAVRPMLAAAVMAVATLALHGTSVFISVPLSAVVYLAATFVFRVITPEEWSIILETLRAGQRRAVRVFAGNS